MKYSRKGFEKILERDDMGGKFNDVLERYEGVISSINQRPYGGALFCKDISALENGWVSINPITKTPLYWSNSRDAVIKGNRHILDIAEEDLKRHLEGQEKSEGKRKVKETDIIDK